MKVSKKISQNLFQVIKASVFLADIKDFEVQKLTNFIVSTFVRLCPFVQMCHHIFSCNCVVFGFVCFVLFLSVELIESVYFVRFQNWISHDDDDDEDDDDDDDDDDDEYTGSERGVQGILHPRLSCSSGDAGCFANYLINI